MPVTVAAKAGVIVASVAVAAAIAIYESPELQRMANDLRRRIALALHSLGDGIVPENSRGEPLFNRPEDANGFFQSSDVDADDETRRRQREELLYWNAMKLSRELEKQTNENEKRKSSSSSTGSSAMTFDDFLTEDKFANEKGSYIVNNTGADLQMRDPGLVRRRVATEGARGLNASLYANPFADEHGIDYDEQMDQEAPMAPEKDEKDEIMSQDIYNATPQRTPATVPSRTMSPQSMAELVSIEPTSVPSEHGVINVDEARSGPVSESSSSELAEHEYMTAGQNSSTDESHDVYASIQAWAQQQQHPGRDFYSPLPVTPTAPLSEMSDGELVSDGQLTPTDSASVAGSGIDVAHEAASQNGSSKYYDIMSEDEDGVPTPAHSWTEVGSVVSESEDGRHGAQHA
ncbi:hypothetical protein BD289DRAFT_278294 [Coniella lustricola]|uniref:Uncharacterized protein n=1 Tax=Coniella lustricola TaxID=2025994 RepID=A0A2T3A6B4_9PEZI|nr:hypothetical protein BD289DRAFT_278294 [Coniella lustricola]